MFRRYSLTYLDGVVVFELRGDVQSRRHRWMGALDAVLMAGRPRFVVSLADTVVDSDADVAFVRAVERRIHGCGAEVVFVPPAGATGQRRLRRGARLTLVDSVEEGVVLMKGTTDGGWYAIRDSNPEPAD